MPLPGRSLIVYCEGPLVAALDSSASLELTRNGAHLWFSRLADLEHRIPSFASLLDDEERTRAERFRFGTDRERFIIGHGLLRELLGNYLGMAPNAITIARGPFGKPFVEGTRLRFNLSDTKDALVIAFANDHELGADIETMTRTVDHVAVGEHYFTAEEVAGIAEAVDGKRRFLELWTRKEAVLKASGVGIMDDLRVLRVDGAMNAMTITHEAFVEHAAESYHLRTWHLGEDHILSLAQDGPINGVRLMGI